jgi:hypothetical protein
MINIVDKNVENSIVDIVKDNISSRNSMITVKIQDIND